ncbi:DUF6508 domain-containing protein [Olsenella uli]
MYERLTRLLPEFGGDNEYGEWVIDRKSKGTANDPIQMPFVDYGGTVGSLMREIYAFEEEHPEYGLNRYNDILADSGIDWSTESMTEADVARLDGKGVTALILGAVRADRFCEGALLEFCENGCMARWLGRLKELDDSGNCNS